jgi:hypothetical protein
MREQAAAPFILTPALSLEGEEVNRPNGRSIRLLAVTRSHRLEPVEYSQE